MAGRILGDLGAEVVRVPGAATGRDIDRLAWDAGKRTAEPANLPDLLVLASGVHVARINSSQWAIGIRGFTSNLARGHHSSIKRRRSCVCR